MPLTCIGLRVDRRLYYMYLALVAAAFLAGCPGGGYVPPEALDPPAGTFSRAIADFAQSTQKAHLATYRRDVRHDLFLATVRDFVETENWTESTLTDLVSAQSPGDFLCRPRYAYQRVALRLGNIQAVSTALGDRLQTPSDDIGKLLKSLGTSYTIRTDAKEPPQTYDAWKGGEDGQLCMNAVEGGDPFVTRTYIGNEIAIAAIPAAITVVETVWAVVKPVFVGTLQNVDRERRNAAVRAYFADQKNVDTLKQELANTESYLDKEFKLAQQRTAGQAAAAAAILFDPGAPHWTKIKTIADTPECRSALATLVTNKSAPKGVGCLDAALAAASGPFDQALNFADAFDTALEQQLPKDADRLSAQVNTLRDIALGKQPDEAKVKALWSVVLRYMTLFNTINDAISAANQKKISDAADAFLKTLK